MGSQLSESLCDYVHLDALLYFTLKGFYPCIISFIHSFIHSQTVISAIIMFLAVIIAYLCIVVKSEATDSCQARISSFAQCTATVMTDGCEDSILNLKDTKFVNCDSVRFFWSYPLHNLTINIVSSFTVEKKPSILYLENHEVRAGVNNIFRIYKNQETDVTTSDDTLVQYSDADYLYILKFVGPQKLQRYGVNINWEVHQQ
ncbi:unnamed protein product [Rotaria socialis]